MKIAQVCPYNFFRSGGVQNHIECLAYELRKGGHDVKIMAPSIKGFKSDREDVTVFGHSTEFPIADTRIELSIALGKEQEKLKEYLQKENFDVIHFHEPWIPTLSMQILTESNSTNIATFHAANRNTILMQSLTTLVMPIANSVINLIDGIIAVSTVPTKYIKEFSEKEINIVPNGIDLRTFSPKHKPFKKYLDGKVNILFVGRLDKRKGVIYLMRAYKQLRSHYDNVRLIIGGKGDEYDKIVKYVKKHNLPDVEMLGFVEEEDKPRLYASCDIYCSPALYGESLGIVLLEAMATGKAVVGGANDGYKTVLKDRGSLFLVKPKKVKSFARKLELLCRDKELRDFMGKWGIEEAKKYSWEKVATDVEKVYLLTAEKKKKASEKDKDKTSIKETLNKWYEKLNGK